MTEKILAVLTLAVCVLLLLRLLIGERRRYRVDPAMRRAWWAVRRRASSAYHWRDRKREAAQVAEEAIRRARAGAEREGNVYKPKAFRKPPDNTLH